MPNYRLDIPQPQPVRHLVEFTESELAEALADYAAKHGTLLPEGQRHIWGLDNTRFNNECAVTLVVDEEIK